MQGHAYASVYDTFRRLGGVYSPAAKLNVLHTTFARASEAIRTHSGGTAALTSMDTVLPVFLSIVARAGVMHLGAELALLDDFADTDSLSGESKILLTTLRAAYCQLIRDHEVEFIAGP